MFIGHFALGFAGKSLAPKVSLGTLFMGAQLLDLLWPTFLLLGLERVRIEPGATRVTPLVFEHYPISHSLVAVLAWGLLMGMLYFALRKDRRGALVIACLVISHWFLDAIVHRPDLPIFPGHAPLVGLGAWSSLALTLCIELALFAAGLWLYMRTTRASDAKGSWGLWSLVALLLVIYAGDTLGGEAPPSAQAIAWVGQAQWLLVLWAYWVDRHRHVRSTLQPLPMQG